MAVNAQRQTLLASTPPAPDTGGPGPAPFGAGEFRAALGRFATGVTLVTAADATGPLGLIVNAFTSVSLEPPLIAICPSRHSLTWSRMRRTGRFGVNVLARHHEAFAVRATPPEADRFADLDWDPGVGGVPLLRDALATLDCEAIAEHPAGDHWIVVGRVDALRISEIRDPLVFFAGAFGRVTPAVSR
jgi:3-hydroxy-9,10-secoandrosta-1,3,5(10)-triene-9,17-dione monooxygenase reductase component